MKKIASIISCVIVLLCVFLLISFVEMKNSYAYDNGYSLYEQERYDYRTRRNVYVDYNGGTGSLSLAVQVDRTSNDDVVEGMWIEGLGIGTLVKDVQDEYHYLRAWPNNQTPREGQFWMEVDSIGATPYLVFSGLNRRGYTYNGIATHLSNGKHYLGLIQSYRGNPACGIGAKATGWSMAKKSGDALKEWLKDNPDLYFQVQWKANTYTIKYNGNGATGGITENSTHTYDVVGYLNNNGFYKDGYRFIGWSTSKNGDVVFKNSQSVLNMTEQNGNTIELYAKWEAIDKESQWMDNVNVPKVYSRFISMQECADGTIPINSLSIHSIWNSPEYYSVLKESLNKKGDDYLKDFEYINERKNGKGK